jgi:hypothetical protein
MQQNFTASTPEGASHFRQPASEQKRVNPMKNVLWRVGEFCAAAVGFLVWSPGRTQPVELLAHRLEVAWADHSTIVEIT